ncbi:GIN domain-containing protein [Photobacterium galatheae]|uniref:Putative auto-transporter adhesin head GIN domain-containing protein n=1 Tax=Photobacterium galatheae TaxID=1654360 RepID=A0A066RMB1_9GAMM|nr:DUF2807 domain-containing protein [Photobacterium galatheae]KDM90231.1 hypothetical protein EA58_18125 [Photobacterium galatheae]MCM0151506.1 DUF2807 domain-containing protein [Photobacterium galatheae]
MNQTAKKVILPASLTGIVLFSGIIGGIPFSFADEQTRTLPLSNFDTLTVEKGMAVNVHCSDRNYLEATGDSKVLDQMQVRDRQGAIQISNESEGGWEEIEPLTLHIYTAQPLHKLEARFGIQADVEGCALAKDSFAAIGRMGSKLTLSGETETLNLDLAMGATLTQALQPLRINNANVALGMGASASLCHAKSVTGQQSAGTRLSVSPDTQIKVNGSYGTSIVFDAC